MSQSAFHEHLYLFTWQKALSTTDHRPAVLRNHGAPTQVRPPPTNTPAPSPLSGTTLSSCSTLSPRATTTPQIAVAYRDRLGPTLPIDSLTFPDSIPHSPTGASRDGLSNTQPALNFCDRICFQGTHPRPVPSLHSTQLMALLEHRPAEALHDAHQTHKQDERALPMCLVLFMSSLISTSQQPGK